MVSQISHNTHAHSLRSHRHISLQNSTLHQSFCQYKRKLINFLHQSLLGFALRRESMASISVPCPKTILVGAGVGSNAQNSQPKPMIFFPRAPISNQNPPLSLGSTFSGFEVSSSSGDLPLFTMFSSKT